MVWRKRRSTDARGAAVHALRDWHHGPHQRVLAGGDGAGHPNVAKTRAQSTGAIAYIFHAHFPNRVTNTFLISVCVAIFVAASIQAATMRVLYAYGRDKMIPAKVLRLRASQDQDPSGLGDLRGGGGHRRAALRHRRRSEPFVKIARVTAWAMAGIYVAYQMVVFGGLVKRAKGLPKDKAYFNLGPWGGPVNIIAFAYGVFMIINLSWPRQSTSWLDTYIVMLSLGVVVVRRRGVRDPAGPRHRPSATIHEIEFSPVDAQAALAMAGGEAGDSRRIRYLRDVGAGAPRRARRPSE